MDVNPAWEMSRRGYGTNQLGLCSKTRCFLQALPPAGDGIFLVKTRRYVIRLGRKGVSSPRRRDALLFPKPQGSLFRRFVRCAVFLIGVYLGPSG